jgi:glycosyltransferase involved in cell wall biosynthesis
VAAGEKPLDGYTLHRLPYQEWRGRLHLQGLYPTLRRLNPDVVQTFDIHTPSTYIAVLGKPLLGYAVFLEAHTHASVFETRNLRWKRKMNLWAYQHVLGPIVSRCSEKCYPISPDAADIAERHHGIQASKIHIESLGVDAEVFRPADTFQAREERTKLRTHLGFAEGEIVCVYTGRFSADKNPLCLARAVDRLVGEGQPYRGLFVGNGPQEPEIKALRGCVVHEFVPFKDVARFYHASEIGVWPRQESTSQLDAAACGLPLVLSDTITVRERVEGNGLLYREDDDHDLARALKELRDAGLRRQLGEHGTLKVREQYSWEVIARRRVRDYEEALGRA